MLKVVIPVIAMLIIGGVFFSKHSLAFASLRFSKATVVIPHTTNAAYYNLFFKSQGDKNFINGAGKIPSIATSYTITYLKKGVGYEYYITAIDSKGVQTQITPIKWIQDFQGM